ncbi:hypothetical protein [Ferruginibacter albus]|uniref:hypothetical protein n=1 Tax=Ferruginibacter albus TaxID=2875540 RepID=UPI001CC6BD85|nr:hypothetical protein [Ferruginibacter albus]UAY51052.1 hypothetical protein K9M53_10670 [Ferruginibacter albus]
MRSSIDLFEALFKRNITAAGNVEYLQQLAEKYAFFAPVQFYLLQQKPESDADYNQVAAKLNLLLNNSYWVNFQLMHTNEEIANITSTVTETPAIEDTVPANEPESTIIPVNEPTHEEVENIEQPQEFASKESVASATEEPEIIPAETPNEPPLPILNFKQETISGTELLFEPLHTTDYFASQGIKLSTDVQPADKLGNQLKSFTQWLKEMKKINVNKPTIDLNTATDNSIEKLAEKSNVENEIVTETMAEVLIQQGKIEKAIEVWQKLSLLNPSKSAYFAAKIEQLKAH